MTPVFDAETLEYAASTSNNTNKVTAVAAEEGAEIEIKLGNTVIENESSPTWESGVNILTIKVTNGDVSTTYTVTVTKS